MTICTVLLCSYNHHKFIEKAINSVLEQKTQYEYKIHIFDDASTDGTSDIIRKYERKYPEKIKAFIAEINEGAQSNIWKAYKSVDTKYCVILECDDYWCDESKLELQITALEEHPECSFCSHQTKIININDEYRKHANNKILVTYEGLLNNNIISYEDIEDVPKGYITHVSSRVIRMSCVDLDSIKYKEAFLYDNCQFYYLLLKGSMYFINRTMNCYQQTGVGNFSGLNPYKRIEMHIRALNDFNSETDFKIVDKIIRDMEFFITYYLNIIERKKSDERVLKE